MAPHVYILLLLILNGYYESADAVSTYIFLVTYLWEIIKKSYNAHIIRFILLKMKQNQ